MPDSRIYRLLATLGALLVAFGVQRALVDGWQSFIVAGAVAIAVHGLSIARHFAQGDLNARWLPWHGVAASASVGLVGPVVDAAPHLLSADLAAYPLPAMVVGAMPLAPILKIAGRVKP